MRVLAEDVGLRSAGTDGDLRAIDYLRRTLEGFGYDVRREPFGLPQGGSSANVIASPRGFAYDRPYLIVGGHFDSLNGPGANDNASGIGVVLETARVLAAGPAALPVVVIGYGAEERQPTPTVSHHVGSVYRVARMTEAERRNLTAMINVDMIGVGPSLIAGRMRVGPREATQRLLALAAPLDIGVRERVTPDWSDNGSYLRKGMNAGWLWSGEDPCCYHNPRDTYDRVQPAAVDRAGRLTLAALRSYR